MMYISVLICFVGKLLLNIKLYYNEILVLGVDEASLVV